MEELNQAIRDSISAGCQASNLAYEIVRVLLLHAGSYRGHRQGLAEDEAMIIAEELVMKDGWRRMNAEGNPSAWLRKRLRDRVQNADRSARRRIHWETECAARGGVPRAKRRDASGRFLKE